MTNGIDTMSYIWKIVATVKKMDNKRKIKLAFPSIIGWDDVDNSDEIVAVNDRIREYCLSKGLLFVDNSNINASCLNTGKLYLNSKVHQY